MWTVYSSSDSDDGSPSPSAPERPPTDARKRPRLGSPSDGAAQAQRRRVPISRQGPVLNAAGWSQGAGVGAARRGTGLGAAGGGRAARRSRQRLPHAQTLESIPERALHLRREIARAAAVPASPDALEVRHGGPVRWGDVDAAEGRFLLSGAADGSVSVCDLGDFLPPQPSRSSARAARAWVHPEVLAVSAQRNRGWVHRAAVASVSWWPSDSGAFVTAGEDSCAALWDTAAGEAVCKFSLGSPGSSMTVAPDGSVVLVGCEDGSVRLCDPESGAAVASLGGQAGATKALAVLPLSPELVAVGTTAGCISIFDVRRLSPVASLDLSSPSPLAHGGTPFAGVEVPLGSRSLSAAAGDVSALVVADRRRAHVKSHAGGARAHEGGVTTITACLGGLFLLSAGLDDQIRLWDVSTGGHMVVAYPGAYNRALRPRQAAADDETGLFFFPSGSAVIAYEMATGAAVATLKGAQASLNACCWDAVYGRVLAGGQDGQWWAWEIGQRQAEETREDWGEADQDSSGDEDMWG